MTHTYPDDTLRSLLFDTPQDKGLIEARERELEAQYGETDGGRIIDASWQEFEMAQEGEAARVGAIAAATDAERALTGLDIALGRLVEQYDVDYVEGGVRERVEAGMLHMRLLLDGIRRNLPDAH